MTGETDGNPGFKTPALMRRPYGNWWDTPKSDAKARARAKLWSSDNQGAPHTKTRSDLAASEFIGAPAVIIKDDDEGPRVNINDPDFRKDMTPDDEKRTGHDGHPAVLGKPWSLAGTGLWLCIGCVQPPVGEGRPKVPSDGFWNALELPSDLASDPLKKAYLTQWIVDEVDKAIGQAGL